MENIGKYRLEEKIGVGGFGEVFKGHDPFIKRLVAVKTCSSADPDVKNRFFQEAEIAGNLHHRNITTVYDFGLHEGLPYLIQEYLSGEDLDVKIRRREFLPFPEKLYYLLQIARGLAYAHSKGVIHRDVKPANIRILEDGTAKIMDFGIAKLAQQESGLTQTGMTLGTAAYLAPEQVRGTAVDLRTDVFSYGVLAYELLTFERPFQGEQISTVIYRLLHHEPKPITDLWPAAPPALVAVIDRCLRKDASQRFSDAGELLRKLEALQKGGLEAPPPAAVEAPTPTVAYRRSERSTRPIQAPDSAPPTPAPVAPASSTLDLEYSLPTVDLPASPAADVQGPRRARLPAVGSLAILLLLALGAAAGGWWFGTRSETSQAAAAGEGDPASGLSGNAPSRAADTETPGTEASEATAPDDATPDDATPDDATPDTATPDTATPDTATPESSAPETSPADPPAAPEPAPPPVTTGRLEVAAAGWTDAVTLQIAGKTYELSRPLVLELPPGRHRAVFELAGDGYSPAPRALEVEVAAGESRRLEVPIPRPGALSVRALIGRPQGEVSIDGEPMGHTLSRVQREPGEYAIAIRPRSGSGEALSESVRLEAGKEVILSYDLDAGTVTSRTRAFEP